MLFLSLPSTCISKAHSKVHHNDMNYAFSTFKLVLLASPHDVPLERVSNHRRAIEHDCANWIGLCCLCVCECMSAAGRAVIVSIDHLPGSFDYGGI